MGIKFRQVIQTGIGRWLKAGAFLWALMLFSVGLLYAQTNNYHDEPANHVYQYSVNVGSRTAYLWVPPQCRYVKAVIVAMANLLERQWLEDSRVRQVAADVGLGIIWIGPEQRGDTLLTADMKPGMERVFDDMLARLAACSGYSELKGAYVIPTGHSAHGNFAWAFANALPGRTVAALPIKTAPLPSALKFKNIPLCYVVGQTTEWPQYRVPDPSTHPGDRDFFWPVVRQSALALRSQSEDNLIGVVTDPGGGHFDWSDNMARFISLYIKKSCQYRLPLQSGGPLRVIEKESGWLTDTQGMEPDQFKAAPYNAFAGKPGQAYWFFDAETARAAVEFEGDRLARKKQMPDFVQDGSLLSVAHFGFAPIKFKPDTDGVSFSVEGGFLPALPPELIGSGQPLGHAPGVISFSAITGPVLQTGPANFVMQFSRGNTGGDIWILASHPGNADYRYAVQPGKVSLSQKLTKGVAQQITFAKVGTLSSKNKTTLLQATSNAGLPVRFYVDAGPAVVEGNRLVLTDIPVRSKYPVKVTVVAYQWGRSIVPLVQTAPPVTQIIYIKQ